MRVIKVGVGALQGVFGFFEIAIFVGKFPALGGLSVCLDFFSTFSIHRVVGSFPNDSVSQWFQKETVLSDSGRFLAVFRKELLREGLQC